MSTIIKNEAVEVTYAGRQIRGRAAEVTATTVTVETEFGRREFPRAEVKGLRFMVRAPVAHDDAAGIWHCRCSECFELRTDASEAVRS